ncbi:MAG TPA: hypothetical protein VMX58_06280 [Patescibacteria group bacterium]|nr:hypothetical protein [Patescibacteria group bacterium]
MVARLKKTRPAGTAVLALAVLWLCLASCSDPYSASIENINFREDGEGFRRFYADIPGYYNRGFYYFLSGSRQEPMMAVQSQIKKISGFDDVGFGVLFCMQDNGDYYRLLIKTDGTYSVTRKSGELKQPLIDWTASDHLEQGYDVLNEIMITYDYIQQRFAIFFNEVPETAFIDASFSGGCSGFYAIIGPEQLEHFPDEPVDIRFRQILPIPDPQ